MRIRLAALALTLAALPAHADMLTRRDRIHGTQVDYKVLLPPAYDPRRAYPLVLVFTGGAQTLPQAQNVLEVDWQAEAQKRGYILVSPAAPGGQLFFENGDKVFPAFLDKILKDYKVAGKIHVAGYGAGGLSAFHIAAQYPGYFSTVTGYPGMVQDQDTDPLSALKPLCVYMHLGARDRGWRGDMQTQAAQLHSLGVRVRLTIEWRQTHRLDTDQWRLARRLFDEIESCR
jgi:poly(3-hydroxybutyrate) depolymerase